jgi:hypothetical protein
MKATARDRRTKGSAGKAHTLHKAISQVPSNCPPPNSREKQNEGMSGRAKYHDPVGHERVSCESIGRNHVESAYRLPKTGKFVLFLVKVTHFSINITIPRWITLTFLFDDP